jgi:hypothetical protein
MNFRPFTILRRATLAIVLAAATTVTVNAFGDPITAPAQPREWDIGAFDDCTGAAAELWGAKKITVADYDWQVAQCCLTTGGLYRGEGICVAPPAEQAQEAEKAPVGTPFIGPDATLWLPPPVGPVVPPPSEVLRAP